MVENGNGDIDPVSVQGLIVGQGNQDGCWPYLDWVLRPTPTSIEPLRVVPSMAPGKRHQYFQDKATSRLTNDAGGDFAVALRRGEKGGRMR